MDENEKKLDEEVVEETTQSPKAEWQYKQNFAINEQMKDVVEKTIGVCRLELLALQKKLKKLTYGS